MKKTALITGASRGIGRAAAMALACQDTAFDRIVLVARDSKHFEQTLAEVRGVSNSCEIIEIFADFDDPNVATEIFDQLDAQGIGLDTIINNAGFTKPATIVNTDLADFEKTMRVNLYSPFKMVQVALQRDHPLKSIINIASTAGISGRAGWLSYSTSKAAVINMSEVLRDELTPFGIKVICLSPGRCATDLRRTLAPDEDPNTIMQPSQVADVIKVMTSPVGDLLQTQNLVVRT
ncbi:SDR family NAD(P)-dependent oxidoreductase [Halocynthiibacter namhaensis]|uniref:SDR family NAD(P)-dependent oxidoreductase n=1 Tax=Halocynthiibacter namhaensis TaxID=1290553 RepID=UPI0009DFF674|nr:SDR family oxidoreductase [Halocynthiibacter namhaensis]